VRGPPSGKTGAKHERFKFEKVVTENNGQGYLWGGGGGVLFQPGGVGGSGGESIGG